MSDADFTSFCTHVRSQPPQIAIILGSGLSDAACRLHVDQSLPFERIPGLCATTVNGHHGRACLGDWSGRRVLVFEGRLHYYEGYPWDTVVSPVQLAASMGIRSVLLTNAAGGIAGHLQPCSLMAIREHMELNRRDAWRNLRPCGKAYSPSMRSRLQVAAAHVGLTLHEGVYASVTGPCYETPAEIRALRSWGADAVGMSTSREAATAAQCGMECAAISCITNTTARLGQEPLHHDDVIDAAAATADSLGRLIEAFLRSCSSRLRALL
jgi:purine-nucleoside phosphorylase